MWLICVPSSGISKIGMSKMFLCKLYSMLNFQHFNIWIAFLQCFIHTYVPVGNVHWGKCEQTERIVNSNKLHNPIPKQISDFFFLS